MSFRAYPSFAAFGVLVCLGCGADTPAPNKSAPGKQPARDIDYEVFESTHELAAADLAALSEVNADGMLRFDEMPDSLADLKVGEVLLTGISKKTPNGLLRVVLAIDEDASGAVVLRTAAAPLQLAFKKLHARVADTSAPFAKGQKLTPAVGAKAALSVQALDVGGDLGDHQSYQVVVFDGDDSLDTKNDQVVLDAELGGGFQFELSIDVDWGAVDRLPEVVTECLTSVANLVEGELPTCSIDDLMPELKLGLEVDPYLDAAVTVAGAATVGFSEDFDVGTITLPPITLGPLVILPSADILATITGAASARFSATAHANIKTSTKVVLSSKAKNSKVVPFDIEDVDADAETPEVDLYAEASAKPGVRLTLALYGVLGPYAMVSAVAGLIADPLNDPCWELRVGLETQLGVLVKTPSLPVVGSLTFLDWNTGPLPLFDESVASGTCKVTAEGESIPPGGGPNAVTLQKPPFKPWAKLLGAPADGADLESVLAYPTGFPFLEPSIDGRYVSGGGGALGLLKLDGDGNATWRTQSISAEDKPLRSLGSVPSIDAGLVTLYTAYGSNTFVLVKQTQAGALLSAATYRVSDDCAGNPQAIVRDADGSGVVVVGECAYLPATWLVHLDAELTVLRASTLRDVNAQTVRLTPTATTRSGDELALVGELVRQGETAGSFAFVVRLDDEEQPNSSSSYACPERLSLYPTAVIPSLAGNLTLVGDASGIGFVMRIKADGAVGFTHFPNLGGGIQSGFVPNSVVELPTTGLVIAATVSGRDEAPPDLILVGLDGNGRTQWGREYTLHGNKALRALGWPRARLTDDGGILITATAGTEGDIPGELLGMKVFARDGTLADGPLITSTEITPMDSTYAVEDRALSTRSSKLTVTASSFDGSATLEQ